MLKHLSITNYALIDSLLIDFESGFTVLTGETGAGKSIILGALNLLAGQRGDIKVLGDAARKCVVEGAFDVEGLGLESWFEAYGFDYDIHECLIRREVLPSGKSRAFINDTPANVAHIKALSRYLIDIHSQHENLLLSNEDYLLGVLDVIGHHERELSAYESAYDVWHRATNELKQLEDDAAECKANMDLYRYEYQQLESAPLTEDLEAMEMEFKTLDHAEDIKQALYQASMILDNDEQSPMDMLRSSAQQLDQVSGMYDKIEEVVARIEAVCIETSDIVDELHGLQDSVEFDPERHALLEERLNLLYGLMHKFGVSSLGELLEKRNELDEKLQQTDNLDYRLGLKRKEVEDSYSVLLEASKALTYRRELASEDVSSYLVDRMRDLGMLSVSMCFEFKQKRRLDRRGGDLVVLMFSANKHVAQQNVCEIASGGELARLMLSLKDYVSRSKQLPTLIFDEIDTGVSGLIAEKMGKMMRGMGAHCQVICITHLPQIAALGEAHYFVYKEEHEEGTSSRIRRLSVGERVEELAHMLSGEEVTEAAINNAKTLLQLT